MPTLQRPARYTPPQIAAHLGVDPVKVRRWIQSGELRAVCVNTRVQGAKKFRYVVLADDLSAFEARRTVAPAKQREVCA